MSPLLMRAEDGAWPVLSIAFALGACIGSFLNVCIHRLPQDESVLRPASRCPRCATPIAWRDNIPLLSWLLLGARCRACRTPIPARYPLVEAATGALAVLALVGFGPSAAAAVAFLFTAALLLVTFVDFDHRFIPDEVSLPGIAVGVGAAFLARGVGPHDARRSPSVPSSPWAPCSRSTTRRSRCPGTWGRMTRGGGPPRRPRPHPRAPGPPSLVTPVTGGLASAGGAR